MRSLGVSSQTRGLQVQQGLVRIRPLPVSEWEKELVPYLQVIEPGRPVPNIYAVLANHPLLFSKWKHFSGYILRDSTLDPRSRELLILRTAVRNEVAYEWGYHVKLGRRIGMSNADFRLAKTLDIGPDVGERDRALLQAADELFSIRSVSDETWALLGNHFHERQLVDLVFTVGQYNLVAMAIKALGIELDEGLPGFGDVDD